MSEKNFSTNLDRAFEELGSLANEEKSEVRRLVKTLDFMERTGGLQGKKVLELGCSVGVLSVAMAKSGADVQGLDKFVFPETYDSPFRMKPEEFAVAQKVWDENHVKVAPHDLALALPFGEGTFDIVVCNAVVEHLHGIHKQLFLEVLRVLKPGGRFIFTTPNLAMLLKRVRFLFGRSPNWMLKDYFQSGQQFTGHVREFTVPECRRMLEWSGFTKVQVFSRPTYFFWHWLKMPRIWHRVILQGVSLLSRNWGDLIFALGRKPE